MLYVRQEEEEEDGKGEEEEEDQEEKGVLQPQEFTIQYVDDINDLIMNDPSKFLHPVEGNKEIFGQRKKFAVRGSPREVARHQ